MLNSFQKLALIPVLMLSAGFFFYMGEPIKDVPAPFAYPEHLAGAFTGGFGEETCHSCHFDYALNWKEGTLTVSGIPGKIQPGKLYRFRIEVARKNMGKAGFQMSSRFKGGSQAGTFQISENDRLMFTEQVPDSLRFLQHAEQGTKPVEDGLNNWTVKWKAPEVISDSIYFNISANAANGDQSEFGDWIYVREFKTK